MQTHQVVSRGPCAGDRNDQIDLVECSLVSLPNETNRSTVHWPLYPKKFTVSPIDGRMERRGGTPTGDDRDVNGATTDFRTAAWHLRRHCRGHDSGDGDNNIINNDAGRGPYAAGRFCSERRSLPHTA